MVERVARALIVRTVRCAIRRDLYMVACLSALARVVNEGLSSGCCNMERLGSMK